LKNNMEYHSRNCLIFLPLILLLSACGGNAGPSAPVDAGPTVDPNLVFTSGAQTVVAQITLDAANRPVPTAALPSTPTLDPALPTLQIVGTPDSGLLPTLGGTTPGAAVGAVITQPVAGLPTLASVATLAPATPLVTAAAVVPDKLQWVSNTPPDKSKIPAGKAFKITWKLQNVGTTTWDETYSYKFYAGTQLAKSAGFPVVKPVKPNTTVDFTVDCIAPTTAADYYSLWVLQRSDGVNVGKFDITLTVQ
jgi:hypothetical protein